MFDRVFSGSRHSGTALLEPPDHRMIEMQGQLDALNRVQAVIRFRPDGTVIDANENFLRVMGYSLAEIQGRHHRIFVEPAYAQSPAYDQFWQTLRHGEFLQSEYKRLAHDGHPVWLQASYNPVFDPDHHLMEVVKFATDITGDKMRNLDFQGQIEAIHRVMAVIEFDLDGTIRTANDNFLRTMGYTLAEIQGRHHSMFLKPGEERSPEYEQFWKNLRAGHPDARVFQRFGKHGKPVWIRASYSPILDPDGHVVKVVKYASDTTAIIALTEQTRENSQSVAAAARHMSASIAEISTTMDHSRDAAVRVLATSAEAGSESTRLNESMRSMEKIVGLIRDIAGRVNMLSLNATIEAARAGEAGKGFAVVAGEVKNLSDQTAKATQQINQEIVSVQQTASRVAQRVQETVSEIQGVMTNVDHVATAMSEQRTATTEISGLSVGIADSVEQILAQARQAENAA